MLNVGNALATVSFTLDIPPEKVAEICEAAGITETESQGGYEAACQAVQEWADEAWPHRLDWITSTPEVVVNDVA